MFHTHLYKTYKHTWSNSAVHQQQLFKLPIRIFHSADSGQASNIVHTTHTCKSVDVF
ncbi:hypothetical protein EXN66_Car012976 [Channa argus]|uniref:Uncharacterized protein n=1 Tax=Channa argus TaxID=215402 RepID=A0A6G1Q536_CHAAH|nr:hypothetical protein EXN66_Car012976 [Channa argus]